MDLHRDTERIQQSVYQKMLESKKATNHLSIETDAESNFDRRENNSEVANQSQQAHKQSNDELKHILKMRLVKGEISKEEYLEILKMIEE